MKNAEKFKEIFKEFATEVWAFPEKDFLTWLNAEYKEPTTKNNSSELEKNSKKLEKDFGELDCIDRNKAYEIIESWADAFDVGTYFDNEQVKEIIMACANRIDELPSVTPQLSVPEVTALAEWTEKLTKECEEAYNKGYADGMKAQEPRKGMRWIGRFETHEWGKEEWCECPWCHMDSAEAYNFCPNCGADFREVDNGNDD